MMTCRVVLWTVHSKRITSSCNLMISGNSSQHRRGDESVKDIKYNRFGSEGYGTNIREKASCHLVSQHCHTEISLPSCIFCFILPQTQLLHPASERVAQGSASVENSLVVVFFLWTISRFQSNEKSCRIDGASSSDSVVWTFDEYRYIHCRQIVHEDLLPLRSNQRNEFLISSIFRNDHNMLLSGVVCFVKGILLTQLFSSLCWLLNGVQTCSLVLLHVSSISAGIVTL